MQISKADATDAPRLHEVWEAAVRATHVFLSEDAIQQLSPLVREILATFAALYSVRDGDGAPYGFLGVADGNIEMLFVHPDFHGRGAGRALAEYAIKQLGATRVDVNEQNPGACDFYRHLGFVQIGRSELDGQGHPFPILHLELKAQ